MNRNENILCCFFEVSLHEILDLLDHPFPTPSRFNHNAVRYNRFVKLLNASTCLLALRAEKYSGYFVEIFLETTNTTAREECKSVRSFNRRWHQSKLISSSSVQRAKNVCFTPRRGETFKTKKRRNGQIIESRVEVINQMILRRKEI